MTRRCSCCGQVLPSKLPLEVVNRIDALRLRRRERLIVDCLIDAYPAVATRDRLHEWAWADLGDDLPSNNGFFTHLSNTRRKLAAVGVTITVNRFVGWSLELKQVTPG